MSYDYRSGLGYAPAYQVSGKPYALGGIDATTAASVTFPAVTRWVMVSNTGNANLRIGFSLRGTEGNAVSNYLEILPSSSFGPVELKLTALHLIGGTAGNVSVMAGLTGINILNLDNSSVAGDQGNPNRVLNWSGSDGVG
jgi:hypothetical protein